MSQRVPNLREVLNTGVLQQRVNVDNQIQLGDVLGILIRALTPTEAAAAVAANAKTLAAPAGYMLDVVATAGGVVGRKTLIIGDASVVPVTGEVVWDGPGGSAMRFAAADAVTASNFLYTRFDHSTSLTSGMERLLGQRDGAR